MESATFDVAIFVIPLACISSRDDYKALLICEQGLCVKFYNVNFTVNLRKIYVKLQMAL